MLLVGMQIITASLEDVWKFLMKLSIRLSYDPTAQRLGIYLREMAIYIPTKTYT